MLLWWLQAVLPTTLGAGLLAWCLLILWLRFRELSPSLSLAGFKMSILESVTDVPKLKMRLSEIATGPKADADVDQKTLVKAIGQKIFGQHHIINEIVSNIYSESLREKRDRPVASYLVAGPSGAGKSKLGKVLGDVHFGRNGWVAFDMATANNNANATALFGASLGHKGADHSSPSIAHLINYPRSVVIVDEIEKTTQEVQNRFLEALQDGVLTNVSTGAKVDVTQAIFIFTTNARQEQCAKAGANQFATVEEISNECKSILGEVFSSAFLSRIDLVFAFQPLNDYGLCELVGSKIIDLIESYPMQLVTIDIEVLAQWVQRYRLKSVDGRDVANDVKKTLRERLNELKRKGVTRVAISDKRGKLTIEPA